MASGSKREKFKSFIRKPFSSSKKKGKAGSNDVKDDLPTTSLHTSSSDAVKIESPLSATVPKIVVSESSLQVTGVSPSPGSGFFTNASHFSVNNPVMMDNTTVHIHGVADRRKAMERLSEHIIPGIAHDSSARDPPPRCHPGTRVKINEHVINWFYDEKKEELLIWVYGPAGVGKSAIMQILAEKLAESKHLGASAFISRPNGRNSSRQLFTTIAYQLAVHIEDYCTFIIEKLGRDPELVNKGMEEQFKNFIVEPFVEKKIGVGGHPWGIILDGLDELDEHRSQRVIIRLIANFVLQHPGVPLLWAIASRPEPHICDTFDEEKVARAHWKKHVPANSKESRWDVEHFLRASLERIQREFPRSVPKKWPSEKQLSTLAAAASGLFVLADTAIRFIEDPRYANPTKRLDQVLSALDGVSVAVSHSRPFASLDALYTSILNLIPSDVWTTTKRVLGTLLYAQGEGERQVLRRLGATSVVLGIDLETIYASVASCYSLLDMSDPKDTAWKPTTFYHASFSDYLLDATRSESFHICIRDIEDELLRSSLYIWRDFRTRCPPVPGLTYESRWNQFFSALVSFDQNASALRYELMWYIHEALFTFLVEKHDPKKEELFLSEGDNDQCLSLLCQLEDATVCVGFPVIKKLSAFLLWLFDIWEVHRQELVSRGIVQEGLGHVQFSQLGTCPARLQIIQDKLVLKEQTYKVDDFGKILSFISQLESRFPRLPILACGSPGKGCLIFRHQAQALDLEYHDLGPSVLQINVPAWIYFVIPFPHSNFYHNAEDFLRASFEAIQANCSLAIPQIWPSKEQFSKLAGAVSHRSVFATIAIQFIEDLHYGSPVECLDQLISLIDEVDFSHHRPHIYVDTLYAHILTHHSSHMWPTAYQVLGMLLYGMKLPDNSTLRSPKGVSVVFGIELPTIYAALSGFSLMVQMPPENFSLGPMTFHHTSFCEYLIDSSRSGKFYVSLEDVKSRIHKQFIKIWEIFQGFSSGISEWEYYPTWSKFCSQYHHGTNLSDNSLIDDFNLKLFHDTHNALFLFISQHELATLEFEQNQDHVFRVLGQLNFISVCLGFSWYHRSGFIIWLFEIWDAYREELMNHGVLREIQFQDLQFHHLEWYRIYSHVLHCAVGPRTQKFLGNVPKSAEELDEYISGLQLFQKHHPQLQVLIGGCPGGLFAVFRYEYTEDDLKERVHQPETRKQNAGDLGYYVLPYPDTVND